MLGHFEPAIRHFLKNEGGYVFDPLDPGGETNFGIAKRFHPDVDVKNLTAAGAIEIYGREYWTPHELRLLDDVVLATQLFDQLAGPLGPRRAIRALQTALRTVDRAVLIDGALGSRTARACNEASSRERLMIVASLASEYAAVYRQLASSAEARLRLATELGTTAGPVFDRLKRDSASKARFINGWLARCYRLESFPWPNAGPVPLARGSVLSAELDPPNPEVPS